MDSDFQVADPVGGRVTRVEKKMLQVKRAIAQYYLSLRLSAMAAMPMVDSIELQLPAPIVRQIPGYLKDAWDERELVQRDGVDLIVTRALRDSPTWSINPN